MGWLQICCSSRSDVVDERTLKKHSRALSAKSSYKSGHNSVKSVKSLAESLRDARIFEPFIKEEAPPRIEFNIRDSNLPLVDSTEILELLHKIIDGNRDQGKPTILSQADQRLGNVSKSDTVRKYIKKYSKDYDYIIWIDAANRTTLKNSFCNLSEMLQNNLYDDQVVSYKPIQNLAKEIFRVLTRKHLLVIYDQVDGKKAMDELEGIKGFLPTTYEGQVKPSIVITSRKSFWDNPDLPVDLVLEPLSEESCVNYLLQTLNVDGNLENRATAARISQGTGRLPLLLKLTVSIIQQQFGNNDSIRFKESTPLQDFLQEYEQTKRRCLPLRMNDARADSRYYIMVHLAMKKILEHADKKVRGIARDCSRLMLYFQNTKIPKTIFAVFFPFENPAVLAQGLKLLSDYCLVTDCDGHIEMHPLVQQAFIEVGKVNNWQSETLHNEILILTNFLANISPAEKYYREILACAVQVEDYVKDDYNSTFNLDYAKFVLDKIKHIYFEKTLEIATRIYDFELNALGANRRNTLNSQQALAEALVSIGRYEDAENEYLKLYISRQEITGKTSKETLMTAYSLAQVFERRGKFRDALELYLESDVIAGRRKSVVALDFMSNLLRQRDIACLHCKLGEFPEAVALTTEAIKLRMSVEGLETIETLKLQFLRGRALRGLGKYSEADKDLRIVIKLATDIRGSSHPLVLKASRELAKVKDEWGKSTEAVKIYTDLIELQLKTFTLGHEITVGIMKELGDVLVKLKRFDDCLKMYNQALNLALAVLPENHELIQSCSAAIDEQLVKIIPTLNF